MAGTRAAVKVDGMNNDLEGAAILFDLDGTLIDTAPDLAAAMNHALVCAGLNEIPPAEVSHLVGYGARRMLERGFAIAAHKPAPPDVMETALDNFLGYYEANIAIHSRPYEGVVDLIGGLRADGAAIAVCTNKREALSRQLIETLAMTGLFDTIVGADTAAAPKPDAAPVRLCMERTGAGRAVFIGDSITDIRAAQAAQIPCLIATFGYGPLDDEADQKIITFDSYGEVSRLIRRALKAA